MTYIYTDTNPITLPCSLARAGNYYSCDDFFKLIVTCYVPAAALKQLNMQSLSDIPTINGVNEPQNLWMNLLEERKAVLQEICEGIVDEFASFEFNKPPTLLEKWFPLRGERAHSLKLFCMYDKRFEISKTK